MATEPQKYRRVFTEDRTAPVRLSEDRLIRKHWCLQPASIWLFAAVVLPILIFLGGITQGGIFVAVALTIGGFCLLRWAIESTKKKEEEKKTVLTVLRDVARVIGAAFLVIAGSILLVVSALVAWMIGRECVSQPPKEVVRYNYQDVSTPVERLYRPYCPCPNCRGRGVLVSYDSVKGPAARPCFTCRGTGQLRL